MAQALLAARRDCVDLGHRWGTAEAGEEQHWGRVGPGVRDARAMGAGKGSLISCSRWLCKGPGAGWSQQGSSGKEAKRGQREEGAAGEPGWEVARAAPAADKLAVAGEAEARHKPGSGGTGWVGVRCSPGLALLTFCFVCTGTRTRDLPPTRQVLPSKLSPAPCLRFLW